MQGAQGAVSENARGVLLLRSRPAAGPAQLYVRLTTARRCFPTAERRSLYSIVWVLRKFRDVQILRSIRVTRLREGGYYPGRAAQSLGGRS